MDERRRYFRINDTIGLNYRIIDAAEGRVVSASKNLRVGLTSLLAGHDQKTAHLLSKLQQRDPLAAEILALMEQKLKLITGYLEVERGRVDDVEFLVKHVNISACGVAFLAQEEILPGSYLALELLLTGLSRPVELYGVVVTCDLKGSNQYYLRIDFDEVSEQEQEALIQYMLKRQGEQLRDMLAKRERPAQTPMLR